MSNEKIQVIERIVSEESDLYLKNATLAIEGVAIYKNVPVVEAEERIMAEIGLIRATRKDTSDIYYYDVEADVMFTREAALVKTYLEALAAKEEAAMTKQDVEAVITAMREDRKAQAKGEGGFDADEDSSGKVTH